MAAMEETVEVELGGREPRRVLSEFLDAGLRELATLQSPRSRGRLPRSRSLPPPPVGGGRVEELVRDSAKDFFSLGSTAKFLGLIDGVLSLPEVLDPAVPERQADAELLGRFDEEEAFHLVLRHYRHGHIGALMDGVFRDAAGPARRRSRRSASADPEHFLAARDFNAGP